jgi:hypothetical protein
MDARGTRKEAGGRVVSWLQGLKVFYLIRDSPIALSGKGRISYAADFVIQTSVRIVHCTKIINQSLLCCNTERHTLHTCAYATQ